MTLIRKTKASQFGFTEFSEFTYVFPFPTYARVIMRLRFLLRFCSVKVSYFLPLLVQVDVVFEFSLKFMFTALQLKYVPSSLEGSRAKVRVLNTRESNMETNKFCVLQFDAGFKEN